jgi:hypothetical protein
MLQENEKPWCEIDNSFVEEAEEPSSRFTWSIGAFHRIPSLRIHFFLLLFRAYDVAGPPHVV